MHSCFLTHFLNKIFSVSLSYRMAKSAINLLQELTIKQGSMPKYDFSEKRVDKTIMQFTCYVSVKQLKTHGTGSSKKEAKHNAAENMLSLLNTNNKIPPPTDISLSFVTNVMRSPANVYEMSSLSNQSTTVNKSTVNGQHIERNYVGLLQVNFMNCSSNIKVQKIVQNII